MTKSNWPETIIIMIAIFVSYAQKATFAEMLIIALLLEINFELMKIRVKMK